MQGHNLTHINTHSNIYSHQKHSLRGSILYCLLNKMMLLKSRRKTCTSMSFHGASEVLDFSLPDKYEEAYADAR